MRAAARAVAFAAMAAAAGVACGKANESAPPATPAGDGGPAAPDGGGAPSDGPLALAPGEAAEVTVAEGAAAVRLATPGGAESFTVVVASTAFGTGGATTYPYTITTGAVERASDARVLSSCALTSEAWRTKAVAEETAPSGAPPVVGATRTLNVSAGGKLEAITAKVAAVGTRAVVWVDATPAHPAVLETAFIDAFLAEFDTTILPRSRALFGIESDKDGDGRIGLLFTPLTKDSSVAFFSGCDLLETGGCPAGNKGEFLYLTPPADIAPPYNTAAAIKEILAHELGHLIHFNRKVLRNSLSVWPDSTYMIEGFGGFAQDVSGFQSGNLYVTKAALDGIADFSLSDTLGARATYDAKRDGVLRGGSYLFVRYLYDRAGGDSARADGTLEGRGGPALVRALLDGAKSAAETLPTLTQGAIADVAMDFYTALAISNADKAAKAPAHAPLNPCFSYLPVEKDPVTAKPRGTDLFAAFHGQSMAGPAMRDASKASGKLRAGGAEYLNVGATAGEAQLGLAITVDAKAAARVRIVRRK